MSIAHRWPVSARRYLISPVTDVRFSSNIDINRLVYYLKGLEPSGNNNRLINEMGKIKLDLDMATKVGGVISVMSIMRWRLVQLC